jgi:hypothetical protein
MRARENPHKKRNASAHPLVEATGSTKGKFGEMNDVDAEITRQIHGSTKKIINEIKNTQDKRAPHEANTDRIPGDFNTTIRIEAQPYFFVCTFTKLLIKLLIACA